MSAHGQDEASAQGAPMAALERENEMLRQELTAAKERERWLQNQIDQIQQRLLPPPRQGIIERIAKAIARLRRLKGKRLVVTTVLACIQALPLGWYRIYNYQPLPTPVR